MGQEQQVVPVQNVEVQSLSKQFNSLLRCIESSQEYLNNQGEVNVNMRRTIGVDQYGTEQYIIISVNQETIHGWEVMAFHTAIQLLQRGESTQVLTNLQLHANKMAEVDQQMGEKLRKDR